MAGLKRRDWEALGTVAGFGGLTLWWMVRGRPVGDAAVRALAIMTLILIPLWALASVVNRLRRGNGRPEDDGGPLGEWDPARTFAKARSAVDRGELWRAKEILQGTLASQPYHRELYEWYGRVLLDMHDLLNAGKYLFLSGVRDERYAKPIATFLDRFRDKDVGELIRVLPSRARDVSRLPPVVVDELTRMGWKRRAHDPAGRDHRHAPRVEPNGLDQIALTLMVLIFIVMLMLGLGRFGDLLKDLWPHA